MKHSIIAFLSAVLCVGSDALAQKVEPSLRDPETRIQWEAKDHQRARPARTRVTVSRAELSELPPERSGRVSTRACPYDCASEGLPASACRDWREGDVCHVRDLRPALADGGRREEARARYSDPVFDDTGPCGRESQVDQPRIEISRIRPTRALFDARQVIRGSVEGECLVEAGLFEDGRKIADIPVETSPRYESFVFSVEARNDRDSEIRVYNTRGQREVFDLADDDYGSGLARLGRWMDELFE